MTAEGLPTVNALPSADASNELALSWRGLTRATTVVGLLSVPALYLWFARGEGWDWWVALLASLGLVVVVRGLVDVVLHRFIPWPSLFGLDNPELREEDVVARRRAWFWRFWLKAGVVIAIAFVLVTLFFDGSLLVQVLPLLVTLPFLLLMNFLILFGPLLMMNLSQIQAFEPGDAKWGVSLADVRGQAEAKEEVRRIVAIWQSGEQFESAGGKRERGLIFLGAPGTGKTMLAKAIATGFNSPFISIPGSGFAATFIGIDAIIVRILARRARKLARKWGGQCIVFIDEIDAVGMRRQALGGGAAGGFGGAGTAAQPLDATDPSEFLFYGPWGAQNPSGDLVLETRVWRERMFAARAGANATPTWGAGLARLYNFMLPGGMGGQGSLALNQLLVVMDGIDNPPFFRKLFTNKLNTLMDATYVFPQKLGSKSLRLPPAQPRREQIYFIGATNVPIEMLDPALTRPGRMGRHVWFRTPTKQDRLDIIDLYIGKVSHAPDLDSPARRDEIARVTNGYSPAMIEQVTSMALTMAHHSGRVSFEWSDLVESITTLESGTAIGIEYIPQESRATAIHEAGHAIAGHAFMTDAESTRLSIRMRGGSLGHHQAIAKEERFSRFQSELFARLVWGLGAMAAERVFYDENSSGVGGDVASVTSQAIWMVTASAMGPMPITVTPEPGESEEDARRRVLDRLERIGQRILGANDSSLPPLKRKTAAQLLGQAYVVGHHLMTENREGIETIANAILEKKEIFGDELVALLESVDIKISEVDYGDESIWPPPVFSLVEPPKREQEER